ncbi:MAG TPA: hypothetical protein VE988_30575, partial [Gemmataceae bacterium]|nr:hypothetical protein [Gemmataceae bacterium]
MKKLLVVLALLVVVAPTLSQQGSVRIYTTPQLPARDTLDKLNLTMAWHTKAPMESMRDGFYSLQLIPAGKKT